MSGGARPGTRPIGPALRALALQYDGLRAGYRELERQGRGGEAERVVAQVAEVLAEVNVQMSRTFEKPRLPVALTRVCNPRAREEV